MLIIDRWMSCSFIVLYSQVPVFLGPKFAGSYIPSIVYTCLFRIRVTDSAGAHASCHIFQVPICLVSNIPSFLYFQCPISFVSYIPRSLDILCHIFPSALNSKVSLFLGPNFPGLYIPRCMFPGPVYPLSLFLVSYISRYLYTLGPIFPRPHIPGFYFLSVLYSMVPMYLVAKFAGLHVLKPHLSRSYIPRSSVPSVLFPRCPIFPGRIFLCSMYPDPMFSGVLCP